MEATRRGGRNRRRGQSPWFGKGAAVPSGASKEEGTWAEERDIFEGPRESQTRHIDSERNEAVGPLLERVRAFKIAPPLLNSLPSMESGLSDILVRKLSSSSSEEIENKIDTAKTLAIKLLQQFNYSVSNMRSTANILAEAMEKMVIVAI
ncbi:hypothetical protein ZIOFF_026314 [Zingiber officinale]|uniref:Uncharacterized protein n=1 Tax=Zingiber officinale TaxID=94328 RepID=A0A8J5L7D1_ZINOF|nr:hypothetical protein ZIOFF_026314 [Zingiber officinale]